MTAFAPWPAPEEVPDGMMLAGWRCASPDHDCLRPLSSAVYLPDGQHHAHWVPVSVAHRPPAPQYADIVPHANVSYCNDRPACVATATAEGPWPQDPAPRTG